MYNLKYEDLINMIKIGNMDDIFDRLEEISYIVPYTDSNNKLLPLITSNLETEKFYLIAFTKMRNIPDEIKSCIAYKILGFKTLLELIVLDELRGIDGICLNPFNSKSGLVIEEDIINSYLLKRM